MTLPWLESLQVTVMARAAADRLPHALLIAGPPGWGQAELAALLAGALLGLDGPVNPDETAHPDFRWVAREDGSEVIKVAQTRQLCEFAVGTRQIAARKVVVINEAHRLMDAAANALLKTLEEPPPHTVFLLATGYASALLPTIRSRCQHLKIAPDRALSAQWLASIGAAPELTFEYGNAPLAIADAKARGEQPLKPLLEDALRGQAQPLATALLTQDPESVLLRWLRYIAAALAHQSPLKALSTVPGRTLLAFQDELLSAQRQFSSQAAASVNHRAHLERLALKFSALAD